MPSVNSRAMRRPEPGSAILIGTSFGTISAVGDDRLVTVTVADSGPGIPGEIREKIFQPFFSAKEEGSGLGLSIARGLVVLHKGVIWVESEYGRGTKMFLTLPARKRVMERCAQAVLEPSLAEDLAQASC